MKRLVACILMACVFFPQVTALSYTDITIKYEEEEILFTENPILINNKTLVQLRPIAEALSLGIEFEIDTGTVYLSNEDTFISFTQNSNIKKVNDSEILMDVPMIIYNNYTFIPVRDLAEPFGYEIEYDAETKTVDIYGKSDDTELAETETKPEEKFVSTGSGNYELVHYYQSQQDLDFPENGRGYCWVCSYAMVFSNVLEEVITPLDIAQYNIDGGYEGNYMAGHEELAKSFGIKLVPAVSEEAEYFGGFNIKNRGETVILADSDEVAEIAIREALSLFPDGVIVRYDGHPHSMVAVSCDNENIYFNDPGISNGEHVTFKETCLSGYNPSDISSIQAFEVK